MDLAPALGVSTKTAYWQTYDARGCAHVAAESIMAAIAAIDAIESRIARKVATRIDLMITRELATKRAVYKGTGKISKQRA